MNDPTLDDLRAVGAAAIADYSRTFPVPYSLAPNLGLVSRALAVNAALLDRVEAAERELDEALAQVARVRELHRRREHNVMDFVHFGQNEFPDWCDHCGRHWPCWTIVALDGRETT